ncbi:tRNA (adenosine(37)-N6)-threonylcarbamoyltransferase complex dimerization subunit type 1 TsaB [Parasphingopyxis algicola]|uniref:tRNA (adenosine(37)-N6)-threonylcarbamoyltransferase complex dimerization subunit type 1 TsaB n=1 Tax=Parasphingopyxis algicola TaxID=2026624 RepID=UPI0015A05EE5|nr:tRNA (adenosine(37)-N6)-threonylcarbamoyltransferase complex dimerization subunit type 1 TsaB [Parasphingopyxis algicola]QLC25161.1 tRNA (adenosine(37)-N6)-threonylcarbamoyltransferase complex dimerization subunit type 1 TsaB [Parasphingopyxis algicola]
MILAIDTISNACSVALLDGDTLVAERHEIVGRGHAEKLVPMIAELPGQGKADSILVDCGPGSFTGLRVGLATARALGLGWQIEVHGYSSLALMAAMAFSDADAPDRLAVTIVGGHGEMFVQRFSKTPFGEIAPMASLTPDAAIAEIEEGLLVGNAAADLAALAGDGTALDIVPRAADTVLLPPTFKTLPPRPIYGRAPDARPPQ